MHGVMPLSLFFAAAFTKNTGQIITWKAERMGVVTILKRASLYRTMNKKSSSLFEEKI